MKPGILSTLVLCGGLVQTGCAASPKPSTNPDPGPPAVLVLDELPARFARYDEQLAALRAENGEIRKKLAELEASVAKKGGVQ